MMTHPALASLAGSGSAAHRCRGMRVVLPVEGAAGQRGDSAVQCPLVSSPLLSTKAAKWAWAKGEMCRPTFRPVVSQSKRTAGHDIAAAVTVRVGVASGWRKRSCA